jgi:XTP/dITP diphosphohydrolase
MAGSRTRQLLVASTNAGKLAEIRAFLAQFPLHILSLEELSGYPKITEDGVSFEENALKKARTLAEDSGYFTLADDSGLEVDALNGAPGIYSARYAGPEADDEKNNAKLLHELRSVPEQQRAARFVCALAFCAPKANRREPWVVRESCEGRIALAPRGQKGFGYDPLFFFPDFGKTFGEIDRATKATVSHRGKALKRFAEALPALLNLSAAPP